jgi:hypothetical protein
MNSIFRATRSRREHSPNFIAGCRAALVRTALSKVKPGFGRSFVLSKRLTAFLELESQLSGKDGNMKMAPTA